MFLQGFLLFVLSLFPQQESARSAAAPAPPQNNFQIAGVLVDSLNGQPLSGAQLFIEGRSLADSGQSTTTDDNGRFVFDNLAPGHYALTARHRGYLQRAYKQHEFFSTAIIVGPGLDTSHLRFPLAPEASISGQVVDEMNDPVRNAQVLLSQRSLESGRRTTSLRNRVPTDDQGRYRFAHLLPGTYLVAVSVQPWYAQHEVQSVIQTRSNSGEVLREEIVSPDRALDVVYPVTFFSNATDISGAVPITLHSGDVETADLTLRPVPALRVTISFVPSGKPDEPDYVWPEVTQSLLEGWQENLSTGSVQIRPGLMEVTGLPSGPLNLTLHSSHGTESSARSLALNLAADAALNMSEAAQFATISGVARMDDGTPVLQSSVQFHNQNTGQQFGAQVQDTGEFRLQQDQSLPPGTYSVSVSGSSPQAVRSLSATGAKVSGRSLEVAPGHDVKLTIVVSKGTGRITGVALKDDKPLDGVMVVLVPELLPAVPPRNDADANGGMPSMELFRRDQSDSDGSFNLYGILPGKYTVIAIENGWDLDWFSPGILRKYLPSGEPVVVSPNAKLNVKIHVVQP